MVRTQDIAMGGSLFTVFFFIFLSHVMHYLFKFKKIKQKTKTLHLDIRDSRLLPKVLLAG